MKRGLCKGELVRREQVLHSRTSRSSRLCPQAQHPLESKLATPCPLLFLLILETTVLLEESEEVRGDKALIH